MTMETILGNILKQLSLCRRFVYERVCNLYDSYCQNGYNLRLQETVFLLEAQAKRLSRRFITIGALYECPEKLHYEFLTRLWVMISKANVLFASRLADPTIEPSDVPRRPKELVIIAVSKDVIKRRLSKTLIQTLLEEHEGLERVCISTLVAKANGI